MAMHKQRGVHQNKHTETILYEIYSQISLQWPFALFSTCQSGQFALRDRFDDKQIIFSMIEAFTLHALDIKSSVTACFIRCSLIKNAKVNLQHPLR